MKKVRSSVKPKPGRGASLRGGIYRRSLLAGDGTTFPSVQDLQSFPVLWTGPLVVAEGSGGWTSCSDPATAEAPCPSRPRRVPSATFSGTRGCGTSVRVGQGTRRLPHYVAGEAGGVARCQSGSWRRWEDLSSHSTWARGWAQRGIGICPRSHSSGRPSPVLGFSADPVSQVEARTLQAGTG